MKAKRLAIVTTHPIQYHGAWFRKLASEPGLEMEVFYCHRASPKEQAAAGFGVEFQWDVSLLDGYPHRFLTNVAKQPGLAGFGGLDTPEIKAIVARERFDAVMINGWHYKSAWQTMRACWNSQTPVMVRSDSHLHTERTVARRMIKRPFYSWFISKLDACLPVGRWSSDYFLHYGAAPDRLFVIPHVVDTDYFAGESLRLSSQRASLRSQWGLDDDAVVFVFAGKFIDVKRPIDFVRAIGGAAKQGKRVMGLMVGDGPLKSACETEARGNNIPVSFAGFLNQTRIAEAYAAADVLVLPSTAETWGLVVNEAMACGRPCLVSDGVGAGPDMVKANETGGFFAAGNVDDLSAAMVAIAADKSRLDWMGGQAKKAAQRYSVNVAVERTIAVMENVAR